MYLYLYYAAAALGLYGLGTPLALAAVFMRHWFAIRRDQRLWLRGKGDSAKDNRDFAVRRRYARLYQVRLGRTRARARARYMQSCL